MSESISVLPVGRNRERLIQLQEELQAAIARGDDLGPRRTHIRSLLKEISESVEVLGWKLQALNLPKDLEFAVNNAYCHMLDELAAMERSLNSLPNSFAGQCGRTGARCAGP